MPKAAKLHTASISRVRVSVRASQLSLSHQYYAHFKFASLQTDKASLLAKAVEHVRDLKQRTAEISGDPRLFPSEHDEIIVLPGSDGCRPVFEASLCCDDRSDLLPELIETLRSLRMKTLRAEMATLGGRVRNVMVLAREKDDQCMDEEDVGFLKEALVALVNRSGSPERVKRRRVMDHPEVVMT